MGRKKLDLKGNKSDKNNTDNNKVSLEKKGNPDYKKKLKKLRKLRKLRYKMGGSLRPVKKSTFNINDERVQKLLGMKTPEEYINYCVESDLSSTEKMQTTNIWLKKTGFGIEEIQYARNRHPYWKAKKMQNAKERNKIRQQQYNYHDGLKKPWDDKDLKIFLDMNDDHTDRELAKYFKRSIPSIQYIRRRISISLKIISAKGIKKVRKAALLKLVSRSEESLRSELKELSK